MREKNIKVLYIKNIFLFLLFGFIISVATIYINYNLKYEELESKISEDSDFFFKKN
jgi:cell division protein FtsL